MVSEYFPDAACEVAFEAPYGFSFCLSLGDAFRDVGLGFFVAGHAHQHDSPQCAVGLAVAAAVEPVSVLLAA